MNRFREGYIVSTTRVLGSNCVSYWLPVHKNACGAIRQTIGDLGKWDDRIASRKNKLKWIVIRNPFARVYSCWKDKVQRKTTFLPALSGVFNPGDPFDKFVDWVVRQPDDWTTDSHFTSQEGNIRLADFHPDIILRFETLSDDWKLLAERVGLNPCLAQWNCTRSNLKDHFVHVESYTESLRLKVVERYRMDFENFGYDSERL